MRTLTPRGLPEPMSDPTPEPSVLSGPGEVSPEAGAPVVVQGDDGRRYRIAEKLGQGGFATVYRVWVEDLAGLRRQVALKVLKEDVPDEVVVRFRDEARMLGLIQHRAIVGVEGLVRLDGKLAVILEYIPGVDLKALIEHHRPPATVALRLIEEVASGLYAAWSQTNELIHGPLRLIHRDIKPANIRITAGGEARVVDFGGARADFREREASTRSFVVGSYRYMAPERLDLIDSPASDIYSLGLVMLELLVGTDGPSPSKHGAQHDKWRAQILERARAQLDGEGHPVPVRERLIALMSSMVHYLPDHRPDARQVELVARELRATMQGPTLREWAERVVPSLEQSRRSLATPVATRRQIFPASTPSEAALGESLGGSLEEVIAPLPVPHVPRSGGVQRSRPVARGDDTAPLLRQPSTPSRPRESVPFAAIFGLALLSFVLVAGITTVLREAGNPLARPAPEGVVSRALPPVGPWTPWPEPLLPEAAIEEQGAQRASAPGPAPGASTSSAPSADPAVDGEDEEFILIIPEPEPHEGRPERPLRFPFGRRR